MYQNPVDKTNQITNSICVIPKQFQIITNNCKTFNSKLSFPFQNPVTWLRFN